MSEINTLPIVGTEQSFSSINIDNADNSVKVAYFNAITSPDVKLKSVINDTIVMKDIIADRVTMRDNENNTNECVRIVIIDTKGKSYECVSFGVANSLDKIIKIFGTPTWENGIKAQVVQIPSKRNNGSMLSLKLV